jgi:hypothetical protein
MSRRPVRGRAGGLGLGAVWLVLALAGPAAADDCGRYLRAGKPLIEAPMTVIEDCMRTGSAQAIATGIVAGIAGAVIAQAVARVLRSRPEPAPDPAPTSPGAPTLVDAYGNEWVPDEHGRYHDPARDEWVDEAAARQALVELEAEKAARDADIDRRVARQQEQADEDWKTLRERVRREAVEEVRAGIDVNPIEHPAVVIEDGPIAPRRAPVPAELSGYVAGLPGLTDAVDEFGRQRTRLEALDDLVERAKSDLDALRQAEAAARTSGNEAKIQEVQRQRGIAMENFRRVNNARVNAAERMAQAGDRVFTRGVRATISLGAQAASDATAAVGTVRLARPISNVIDQFRRGNLPGQRAVFRGEPATPLTIGPAPPSRPSGLPTLRPRPGDAIRIADPGQRYGARRVIADSSIRGLGESTPAAPGEFRINPRAIRREAQEYAARHGLDPRRMQREIEILDKHHEGTHLDRGLHRDSWSGLPSAGERIDIARLEARDLRKQMMVEDAVNQALRRDFRAGRIQGVSEEGMVWYENHVAAIRARAAKELKVLDELAKLGGT